MEGTQAEKLRRARTDAGLSQEELARQLGVSVFTVSRWETGKVGIPQSRLESIGKALSGPEWDDGS